MRLLSRVLSAALLAGGAGVPGAALGQERPDADPYADRAPKTIHFRVTPGSDGRPVLEARDDVHAAGNDFRLSGDVRVEAVRAERQKGAYLGVATSPPTPIVREQLKLAHGMGLVVDVVEKQSPAEEAGLKQYDVLTKLGDQLLINGEQLAVLVRSKQPGDEVELTVVRGGESRTVKAKLIEHELPPLEDIFFYRAGPGATGMPGDVEMWHRAMIDRAAGRPQGQPPQFAPPPPPRPGERRAVTATTWSDGEHVLTVTTDADKPGRHLIAKDNHGAVLYDGDLDGDAAQAKIPTIVREKLKKMDEAGVKPPKPDAVKQ
jgi:hypothetical protein